MARVQIAINHEKCHSPVECHRCIEICPQCVYKMHLPKIDKGKAMPTDVWKLAMWFPGQCVGCLECIRVCPEGALELIASCEDECPAHVDIPSMISLIRANKEEEALKLHRERNPFVETCARACPHTCDVTCERKRVDGKAVNVRSLKRYMADAARSSNVKPVMKPNPHNAKKKVAVIGAGPSGLSCAYFLRRLGYPVTVFDKSDAPGGIVTSMIPLYRLPEDAVKRDIDFILSTGIELKLNCEVGKDVSIEDLRKDGYQAFYIGIGAQNPSPLNLEGEELNGVIQAWDLLKDFRKGIEPKVAKKVSVIGGGNAAIDAARTAFRFGADVTVIYRRDREAMPAIPDEIEEAEKEGINFIFLARPLKVVGEKGKVKKIICGKMEIKGYDLSGRRKSVPLEGEDFEVETDIVIAAIGQKIDAESILKDSGIGLSYTGYIYADSHDMKTTKEDIFAGGDAVTGPAMIADAVGTGEKAAISINSYLSRDLPEEERSECFWLGKYEDSVPFNLRAPEAKYNRAEAPTVPVSEREKDIEVELSISREDALRECERCLRCDYIEKKVNTSGVTAVMK